MAIVGLLGGIAPASTVDYYQRLIAGYRARVSDGSYPGIIINSIDLTAMLRLVETGRMGELTTFLGAELARLHAAGADLALMTSNTPHMVFAEVERIAPLPLVSIVEAAREQATRHGFRRVGLLGTRFTMSGTVYSATFGRAGIEVVTPTADEQRFIHERYMTELVPGDFRDETRDAFAAISERMRARDAVDCILLAGTELPLLLRGVPASGPFIDTTAAHVEAVIDRLFPVAGGAREPV